HSQCVNGLAFSPDGKLLASAGTDHIAKIWDANTGQLLKELIGSGSVVFSTDGKSLAANDGGGTIKIWDVVTWQEQAAPTDMLGRDVPSIALSPDGRYCAAGACDHSGVILWRIQRPGISEDAVRGLGVQPIAREANGARVWNVAFSPGSELLAWVEAEEYRST